MEPKPNDLRAHVRNRRRRLDRVLHTSEHHSQPAASVFLVIATSMASFVLHRAIHLSCGKNEWAPQISSAGHLPRSWAGSLPRWRLTHSCFNVGSVPRITKQSRA